LDFEKADQIFIQHSKIPVSQIFGDAQHFHFGDRGHQFEAEWLTSQLCQRAMILSGAGVIDAGTQFVKSGITAQSLKDVSGLDGFRYAIQDDNSTKQDTLILDALVLNLSDKPLKLVSYAPVVNEQYLLVNGGKTVLTDSVQTILSYAEIGLYHIQVMSGTGEIDFSGFKFENA